MEVQICSAQIYQQHGIPVLLLLPLLLLEKLCDNSLAMKAGPGEGTAY
jgi:hypothetical protein